VLGVLEHRAYLDGTRYYETAECFLFFSARLLDKIRDEALHAKLEQILRERVLERAGCTPGDALALAMRVIVGAAVGLRLERDLAALLPLQYEDGGWGPSWMYKYGSSGIKIGNRGLTTALALNAIATFYPPQPRPQTQPHGQEQEQEQEGELELEKEKLSPPYKSSPLIGNASTTSSIAGHVSYTRLDNHGDFVVSFITAASDAKANTERDPL
jgi:hypothetical protein